MKGDVVVLPFPFSDLSSAKRRSALVLAELEGDDVLLCMITGQTVSDSFAVPLTVDDFETGGLRRDSNARPSRLFTADRRLIAYQAGRLTSAKIDEVIDGIVELLRA